MSDADKLRAQKAASTDPARLEREAKRAGKALLELRDRLKAATGPDWKLSGDIALDIAGWRVKNGQWWRNPVSKEWGMGPPHFTASIDAAVTLIPDGHLIENLGEMRDCGVRTGYWLVQFAPRGPRPRLAPSPITAATLRAACDGLPLTSALTPALALCLARVTYELEKQDG